MKARSEDNATNAALRERLADETFIGLVFAPFILGALAFAAEAFGTMRAGDDSSSLWWASLIMLGLLGLTVMALYFSPRVQRFVHRWFGKRSPTLVLESETTVADLDPPPQGLVAFASPRLNPAGEPDLDKRPRFQALDWIDLYADSDKQLRFLALIASEMSRSTAEAVKRRLAESHPDLEVRLIQTDKVLDIDAVRDAASDAIADLARRLGSATAVAVDITGGPSATTAALFVEAQRHGCPVTILDEPVDARPSSVVVLLRGRQ